MRQPRLLPDLLGDVGLKSEKELSSDVKVMMILEK